MRIYKNKNGYSLLEAMVVVGIVALVAAVANFNLQGSNRSAEFRNVSEQFITDIEQMRVNAVNGYSSVIGALPVSHGIFLDSATPGQYILFEDTDDHAYTVGEEIRTVTLPAGYELTHTSLVSASIAFEEITGDLYINGAKPIVRNYVRLNNTTDGMNKTLTINQEGLLYFDQLCGDGVQQINEECDTGELISNDNNLPIACDDSCVIEYCGDGIVQTNNEIRNPDGTKKLPGTVKEQCEPGEANCNSNCRLTGGGGGGCSITPYTPTDSGMNNWFFALLMMAPIFVFMFRNRLVDKRR